MRSGCEGPIRRLLCNAVAAAGLIISPLLSVHAQTIRGSLLDSLTSEPIEAAFVVVLDSNSVEIGRSITDDAGRFVVRASAPGAYSLRTERIGFGSTVIDLGNLGATEARDVTIRVNPIVVRLDSVTVTGDATECLIHGEQGLATATVWEEARKVLAAVAWGQSQTHFTYHTRRYDRILDRRKKVEWQKDSLYVGDRVLLFRSRPVSELQEYGYASIRPDSFFYYVPDAEAFFSDAFLNHHCFNLLRDDDHPGLIGLEFEPVRGRALPDVRGVLWLDELSAELMYLDLRYTNLGSRLLEAHAEGRVEFERLPRGPWFVSGWWIRMPLLSLSLPDISAYTPIEVLAGFEEDGGEVLRVVYWPNVVVWERR